jgi:hypothetical protein
MTFDFNGTLIQTVNIHKHLGVIFSCDCKWIKHINTIIEKASKQLNISTLINILGLHYLWFYKIR